MTRATTGSAPLMDTFLPNWQFREIHNRRIPASPSEALRIARALRIRDVPVSGSLLALRLAPAAIAARRWPVLPSRSWIELAHDLGFVELASTEHEVVLGAVGRFWRFRETLVSLKNDEYRTFDEPGFAKAAINLHATDLDDEALLTTETRVCTTDAQSARTFRLYWLPIRAAGEVMRREFLAAVARQARRAS